MPNFTYTAEEYQAMIDCYEESNNNLTHGQRLFLERHGRRPSLNTILQAIQRIKDYGTFRPAYADVGTSRLSKEEKEKKRNQLRYKKERLERNRQKKIKREQERKKEIKKERKKLIEEKRKVRDQEKMNKNRKEIEALYSHLVPSFILEAKIDEDISSPLHDSESSDIQDQHGEDGKLKTSDSSHFVQDESSTSPQKYIPIYSDHQDSSMLCELEESELNGTTIQKKYAVPEVPCNFCHKEITGFRYRCLVCPDYEMCGECERRGGHHDDHYVLRVPLQRPTLEVEQVESAVRQALSSLPIWKQASQRAGTRKKTPPRVATKKNLKSGKKCDESGDVKSETDSEPEKNVEEPTETVEDPTKSLPETATIKEEVTELYETVVKVEFETEKADPPEEEADESSCSDESEDVPLSRYSRYVPPNKKRRDDSPNSTTPNSHTTMQYNVQSKEMFSS